MSLDAHTVDRLESFVRDRLAADSLPGLSLAVVDRDGLVYAEGFGSRDLAANDPATPQTLYGIGSVTKSFTALAVTILAERGRLNVDDPVAEHAAFPLESPGEEPVRLHHLLSHSSGLPSLGVSEALIARRTRSGEAGVPLGSR
jgi:CubicO group peptidase (beta-lactamase class C family)